MPREVLKLSVDVPLTVRLDRGPEGVESDGVAGRVDYQYTVNNDACVMWLPPPAREALLRAGVKAGDSVQIVKSLRGQKATYAVQVVQSASGQAVFPAASFPPLPKPLPPPPAAPTPPTKRSPASVPDMRSVHRDGLDGRIVQPARSSDALEDLATSCLTSAARASWRAYQATQEDGFPMDAPTWTDIRALAVSMFLSRAQRS